MKLGQQFNLRTFWYHGQNCRLMGLPGRFHNDEALCWLAIDRHAKVQVPDTVRAMDEAHLA